MDGNNYSFLLPAGCELVGAGDICAGRHGGNSESAAANAAVQSHKAEMRRRLYDYFRECGPEITESAAAALTMRMSTASARVSFTDFVLHSVFLPA
jgi:hypothetical protein